MLQISTAFVITFLEGTLAGVFIGSAMMEHAAQRLPAGAWIAYNQAKGTVYGPSMPIFYGVTLLASLAATAILPDHVAQGIAAACLLVAGVVTKAVNLPLNAIFETWTEASFPTQWERLRARWHAWNFVRCGFAIAAFAATIWATIASGRA